VEGFKYVVIIYRSLTNSKVDLFSNFFMTER